MQGTPIEAMSGPRRRARALDGTLLATLLFFAGSCSSPQVAPEPEQRPLFVSGRDGYHTYRIPALLTTVQGTLLAFCEGRKDDRR